MEIMNGYSLLLAMILRSRTILHTGAKFGRVTEYSHLGTYTPSLKHMSILG